MTTWQQSLTRRLEMENKARVAFPRQPMNTPSSKASSKLSSRATSKMTVRSSTHGRKRRGERKISKLQLQRALKHGRRIVLRPGVSKYYHEGITFVYDEMTRREITSYVSALDIPFEAVTRNEYSAHKRAIANLKNNHISVTSHSVLLVDTSGSMRNSDVQGSRSRLSAVFLSIAEDFIKPRIKSKIAGSTDAISLIQMGEEAKIVFTHLPTDWHTYNRVLEMYKDGHLAAQGHCCYKPSLDAAQEILQPYDSASCQLCLVVFSDGRPSDFSVFKTRRDTAAQNIVESVETMASGLGNRFTITTIGMGSASEFTTLQKMANAAAQYGSKGKLELPNFSSSGLRAAVSSVCTELTESQLNPSSVGPARVMRIQREKQKQIPALTEVVMSEDFDIYMAPNVKRHVYDHLSESHFREVPFQHDDAKGIAIRNKAFGEGSERFAFQFFEVGGDGSSVVGEAMVAKTTRFVDQDKNFAKRFSMLQYHAQLIAEQFNSKLDSIPIIDCSRVEFLRSSIYEVTKADGSTVKAIVEPLLFNRWQKWNSNNGWAKGNVSPQKKLRREMPSIKEEPDEDVAPMQVGSMPTISPSGSGSTSATSKSGMAGGAEVIDMTGDDDDQIYVPPDEQICVPQDLVAQAFSHFSYVAGGRKLLLCDLQGATCGRDLIQFTDPVIHSQEGNKYGKTDRGAKGIEDFLHTHQCNVLCDFVTVGFFPARLDTTTASISTRTSSRSSSNGGAMDTNDS